MKYLKITSPDIENGPGCRVTLWIPGCTHKCPGCHNAWTADYNQGQEFTQDTYEELCNILDKPYIKGLTISGGDPMDQDEQTLIDLIQLCFDISLEYPTKDIWLYTGYKYEEVKDLEIMQYIDILVDGEFVQELADPKLHWRGSSNQKIIDIKNNKMIY
jgi:anaerobic ribonucleoside-triphosphate reductase activating protein